MSDHKKYDDEYERQMKVFRDIAEKQAKFFKKKEGDSEKYSFYIRFDELRESLNWTLVQDKPKHIRIGDFQTIEGVAKALIEAQKNNEK